MIILSFETEVADHNSESPYLHDLYMFRRCLVTSRSLYVPQMLSDCTIFIRSAGAE
jgi:hypothetical protein